MRHITWEKDFKEKRVRLKEGQFLVLLNGKAFVSTNQKPIEGIVKFRGTKKVGRYDVTYYGFYPDIDKKHQYDIAKWKFEE